ncbi:MAG: hypothetical protein AAGA01_10885, partial [Cyanobacteria bacterium P01_E01_bin.43]
MTTFPWASKMIGPPAPPVISDVLMLPTTMLPGGCSASTPLANVVPLTTCGTLAPFSSATPARKIADGSGSDE